MSNLLERLINNERTTDYSGYTLDSITCLLDRLGNPHKYLKCLHVAGTNGKGSTALFLNAIFMEAGYRTGLYTSPHLKRVNERIRIDNSEVDDQNLDQIFTSIDEIISRERHIAPTYFDVLTAAAFCIFRSSRVDIAIIETGLGGLKDSTNVIFPLCSLITEISFDHMHILGNTLEDIAAQKAGIIKRGVPVITCNNDENIVAVLRSQCRENSAPLFIENKDHIIRCISSTEKEINFNYEWERQGNRISIKNIKANTPVSVQASNAGLAITASLLLKDNYPSINYEIIVKALARAVIPGRFEFLHSSPPCIFDPAHNPSAITSLFNTIKPLYPGKEIVAIITMMKDKDYNEVFKFLCSSSITIIYFIPGQADARTYIPAGTSLTNVHFIARNEDELQKTAFSGNFNNSVFVFTGSFRIYETALRFAEKLTDQT